MLAHFAALITITLAGASATIVGQPRTVYLAERPGVMRVVVVGLPHLRNRCTTFRCTHPFNPRR